MQVVLPSASVILLSLVTNPTSVGLGATSMRRWSICRKKQCRTFARMLPPFRSKEDADRRRWRHHTHTAKGDNHGEDQKKHRVCPRHLGRRGEREQDRPRSSAVGR